MLQGAGPDAAGDAPCSRRSWACNGPSDRLRQLDTPGAAPGQPHWKETDDGSPVRDHRRIGREGIPLASSPTTAPRPIESRRRDHLVRVACEECEADPRRWRSITVCNETSSTNASPRAATREQEGGVSWGRWTSTNPELGPAHPAIPRCRSRWSKFSRARLGRSVPGYRASARLLKLEREAVASVHCGPGLDVITVESGRRPPSAPSDRRPRGGRAAFARPLACGPGNDLTFGGCGPYRVDSGSGGRACCTAVRSPPR